MQLIVNVGYVYSCMANLIDNNMTCHGQYSTDPTSLYIYVRFNLILGYLYTDGNFDHVPIINIDLSMHGKYNNRLLYNFSNFVISQS